MSSSHIPQDNLIGRLTDRLFSAVSGDDTAGRPPLPAFVYDGRAFNPRQWKREITQRDAASTGLEEYRVSYDSPDRLLRLVLDFKIYSDYPLVEILLDRLIPYSIGYGITSLFTDSLRKPIKGSLVLLLAGVIRLISHTVSGILLWYSWTGFGEFMTSFYASLIYNGSYVMLTTALAIVLFISMNRILDFGLKKTDDVKIESVEDENN